MYNAYADMPHVAMYQLAPTRVLHFSLKKILTVANKRLTRFDAFQSLSQINHKIQKETKRLPLKNTGRITAVSDTPRTEIGQMQLIVTSTAANGLLKCNW
ncbi:hypothetical protein OUZ56_016022 [Daphnia magna]|uniref:Uncharacterized protein n=1 Tax=Daphnia magna TaxID=35525 RepID=A0ABR0APG4_9CRUS|nr:hypothetical protein OUZ56_016022 [Daphnia magna]